MSEAKHTPIEQWIEESAKYFENDSEKVNFLISVRLLLTYLGLSGIENPKELVENRKITQALIKSSSCLLQLQSKITKLQAELKQAKADKAEAWDEGLKSGKNYVESSMSCDEGVRLPENPYKPDFNQNSMIERFGELEDEFKVE